MTNVTVGDLMIIENTATISLSIYSLTTAHAGQYACRATLINEDASILLEHSVNITFTC